MANYAEMILNQGSKDPVFQVLLSIQQKAEHGIGLQGLTTAEKVIYLIGDIENEVNNGGFSQYLYNSSGKFAKAGVQALKEIGANFTAQLLQKAIDIYQNGPTNEERNSPEVELTAEQVNQLNDLDNTFYQYNDRLSDLQIAYIKGHINEFVG